MPDKRFPSRRASTLLLAALLLSVLIACSGPAKQPPGPPADGLRTITGSINLPPGHTLNLTSLTMSTPMGTYPVSANGEFSVTIPAGAATEVGVETTTGELLLLGVTSATTNDPMLISLTGTAEALLYYLVGGMWLPEEQQDKVRSLLEGTPAATNLATELERQLLAGGNGVANPDAGVLAALDAAHTAILGDTRPTGLTPGTATSVMNPSAGEYPTLAGFELIVTSADDGSNIIIEPNKMQAGVEVLHNPTGTGVVAQNSYRRPAALLAYEVAWEDADSIKHDVDPPLLVERVEVPSTGQLELLNALTDIVTGDSPWSPVLSPPLTLTGHTGASRTHYQLILVGPSTTDASWPIMNDARFTSFHGNWNDIMIDKSVELFLDDLLLPLIEVYALGSMAKLDASKLNKMRERVRISHNQHLAGLGVYLTQGQAGYGNALKFLMAELIENRTYRLDMLNVLEDALTESTKNKAAIDAMEARLSSRASASSIAAAVQAALVSGDVAKIMYDLASSPKVIDWTVIAAPALFTLTPAQAKVTRDEPSAKFTVTPQGQTTGNYLYRWTTSANHGDLSDLLTDGTTITTTSHEIWYFHNRPHSIENTDHDTITVEIFEAEPGATSIPASANPIARMAAEVHGDEGNLDPRTVISAGSLRSLALSHDGTVWAWGYDVYGELGDGTIPVFQDTPVQLPNLTNLTGISTGHSYSLVLHEDGTVWAWGYNYYGQLGDGTTTNRPVPVQVLNLTNITSINASQSHSLALREDGTVWAWGDNRYGQLGDGTTTDRHTPVQIPSLTNITSISAGGNHSLALREDGTVWAWGLNSAGQLGNDDLTNRHTPTKVPTLTNNTSISAGTDHSFALSEDGTVWAWGWTGHGQLGDGTTASTSRPTPVKVLNLTNITSINAGNGHSLALHKDGTVWAWGWNLYGQLGNGPTTDQPIPVKVLNLTNITSINAGDGHSLALHKDGTVWAWGWGSRGQLGDGTRTDQHTPVKVKQPN